MTNSDLSAALSDLSLEYDADVNDPSRSRVFLKNNNQSQGIIGSMLVDSSSNFTVSTISRTSSRAFFPHAFEIRVAPGQRHYIGKNKLKHWLRWTTAGWESEILDANCAIVGARYVANEPWPLPTAGDLESTVYIYDILNTVNNSILTEFISVNHVYGVEFDLIGSAAGTDIGASLYPMESKLLYEGRRVHWNTRSARFFEVSSMRLLQMARPE